MISKISEATGISIGALVAIGGVALTIVGGGWTLATAVRAADLEHLNQRIDNCAQTEKEHRQEIRNDLVRMEERLIEEIRASEQRLSDRIDRFHAP